VVVVGRGDEVVVPGVVVPGSLGVVVPAPPAVVVPAGDVVVEPPESVARLPPARVVLVEPAGAAPGVVPPAGRVSPGAEVELDAAAFFCGESA
jgi:hypothetical protein